MTASIHHLPSALSTVHLDRLDGTPWTSEAFRPNDGIGAAWDWIVATVATELSCSPGSVGTTGEQITVDGLPCYVCRIVPCQILVDGRPAVVVDEWVEDRDCGYDYRFVGEEVVHWIRAGNVRLFVLIYLDSHD